MALVREFTNLLWVKVFGLCGLKAKTALWMMVLEAKESTESTLSLWFKAKVKETSLECSSKTQMLNLQS
jgi:hypothetical protein